MCAASSPGAKATQAAGCKTDAESVNLVLHSSPASCNPILTAVPSTRADEPFVYEQVVAHISALVRAGTLRPGDRLPSVRRLSVQRGVSIPTVLQAYRVLEARRVIAARPRSGFYVRSDDRAEMPRAAAPATLPDPGEITTGDLITRCVEMLDDPALIPLGSALPDPDLLPSAALARILGRSARRDPGRSASHFAASGVRELRHEIARRAIEAGITASADDVVVTCGCAEALALCLRAITRPGDAVAIESPTYYGTLQALESLRLKAVEIPVDPGTGISLEVLATVLERGGVAAVVVTPNVHNPLGSVMPDERKQALVELSAAHRVPIIEDETYADLHFGTQRPRSLQAFDREGLVLSCGSFSKSLAPGYRLGWTLPRRHRNAVLHHKAATTMASPVPTQLAIAEYLASGAYEPHLRRLRRTFRGSLDRWTFEVRQRLPESTRVSRPAGGFLLWVQLPQGTDAVSIQRRGVSRGLGVAPGPAFSASGAYPDCLRLNAGYPWSDRTAAALDLLAELIAGNR